MSVYYRIRNAQGAYWDGYRFCTAVHYADAWRDNPSGDLERLRTEDPTARVVKVTVKRKTKWPVERAMKYLGNVAKIKRKGYIPLVWAQNERGMRFILGCMEWPPHEVDAAVAEVLGGKL